MLRISVRTPQLCLSFGHLLWAKAQNTKQKTENRKHNQLVPANRLTITIVQCEKPRAIAAKSALSQMLPPWPKELCWAVNFITRLPGFSLLSNATALALAPSPFAWISVPIKFTKLNDKFLPQIVANRIKVNSRINRAFPPSVENQCSLRSIFPPHFPASRPAKGACLSVSQEWVAGRGGLGRVEGKVVLAWPSRCGHFNAHNPYR